VWIQSRQSAERIAAIILAAAALIPLSLGRVAAQKTAEKGTHSRSCPRLHAGIRAQIIPPSTETPSVILSFVLLNDSEKPLDVEAGRGGSWSTDES
jgi:hypothetical protein